MTEGNPLVSVVVPAFNAAETIRETLQSISQQTYRALEVAVVDDGSTDRTAVIAHAHCLADPRFRVISKDNGGVASARNEGIRASRGEFVAFIDADDLWHPTKIAKQVRTLAAGGPDMALVYAPFRMIDAHGHVIASPHKYGVSGWVIYRHFYTNLVGNGSALLIRRKVLEEFGGFDPRLKEQGAEGCEDLLLQLRITARYRFGEVSEYLVGYRKLPDNMSSNTDQMIRSGTLAVRRALAECHDIPGLPANAMLNRYEWQRLRSKIRSRRVAQSLRIFARLLTRSPVFVAGALRKELANLSNKAGQLVAKVASRRPGRSTGRPPHFYEWDPGSGIDLHHNTPTSRVLRRLAELDQAYRPNARQGAHPGPQNQPGDAPGGINPASLNPDGLGRSGTYQEG
jgi:glycosyltransferase involved in cell wall biosynthesis